VELRVINTMVLVKVVGMMIKNQEFLKKENLILVLEMISKSGPISRAEISKQTKMSATSASRIVSLLIEKNLITEVDIDHQNVGRKANYYTLNKNGIYFIGVELDANNFRIGLMNFDEELVFKKNVHLEDPAPNLVVEQIVAEVNKIKKKFILTPENISGLCVGLPGIIDPVNGVVNFSVQLKWEKFHLSEALNDHLGIPIKIDNELKLKALAEYKQCNKDIKHLAILGFGNGVGSALISNGEINRGKSNFAGEIGHTIVDPEGSYCPCGNFGCLQTYIAEPFLLNEASKMKKIEDMEELIAEAERGEIWAKNLISKAAKYASIAINNTVCTFNPDFVILSGSMIENHPYFQNELLNQYPSLIWGPASKTFDLAITRTKDEGVIMGSAINMKKHFVKNIS
jgi:predicted NBD/HSP70 family sugar kinase